MRELEIERACLTWLNQNGYYAWKVQNGAVYDAAQGAFRKRSPFHLPGVSDCVAVRGDGVVFFIEFKTQAGRQSEHQRMFQYQLEKRGANYLLIRSLEELKEKLHDHSRNVAQP
jgi:hypothetical protein